METKTELRKDHCDTLYPEHKGNPPQLTIKLDGSTLLNNPTPTYLGVKMDRQLTFKQHIEAIRGKVTAKNNLQRRFAGSSWGAHTSTLRTGALALVYSASE